MIDTVIIHHDNGGVIVDYLKRFNDYNAHGVKVVIDGNCMSACTLVTRVSQACATENGVLGFHKPNVSNSVMGGFFYALYPAKVRAAIEKRGGLTNKLMLFPATEFLKKC